MSTVAKLLAVALALFLTGCDPKPVVVLDGDRRAYFGVWEHTGSEYGNGVNSDNLLLIFHPDSSVSYKRCINRLNGYHYVTLPDASITRLTDKELVISRGLWIFNWSETLPLGGTPLAAGDQWYLQVDGLKLRKLKSGEPSTHEAWKCESKKKDSD